jgi:hypothetical protein
MINFAALQQLQEDIAACIEYGNDKRAGDLLADFAKSYPFAWAFFSATFTGTPEEAVEKAAHYWPDVKKMPGAVEFARKLQERVKAEVDKKR